MAAQPMTPLLEVDDLEVCFGGDVAALRGVSFSLDRGESLAIVGESGSGKSTLALCLAGLVQPPEAGGSVRIDGREVMGATPEVLRDLRWATIALALQGAPFNPVATVGSQVAEPLRERLGMSKKDAWARATELAGEALLDPSLLERYPTSSRGVSAGERRWPWRWPWTPPWSCWMSSPPASILPPAMPWSSGCRPWPAPAASPWW
jgi:ABC-type glutathione transport system ATPase component